MRLSNRIALTTSSMVAVAMVVVGSMSFWTSQSQIVASARQAIDHRASLSAQATAGRLKPITETFQNLASNTVVFNALIDSAGLETYLLPFFRGFTRIGDVPIQVGLLDFQGKVVAETAPIADESSIAEWYRQAISKGESTAHIFTVAGRRQLVLANMLLYPRTNTVEGVLVFKFPLDLLLEPFHSTPGEGRNIKVEFVQHEEVREGAGVGVSALSLMFGTGRDPTLSVVRNIEVASILEDLELGLRVDDDGHALRDKLRQLMGTYILISVVSIMIVFAVGYWAGHRLTEPARRLEALAGSVAANEAMNERFKVTGKDEINQVGEAFNQMLDHLGVVYRSLNNTASRLGALVRSLPDTVAIVSEHGEVVSIVEELDSTGWGNDEREKRHITAPMPPDLDRLRVTRNVIRDEITQTLEFSVSDADKEQWFEATVTPLSKEFQGPPSAMWVIRDVTEHKNAEALLRQAQKMEAVGQLTGGVAHDFNNLLAVILGNVDLIQEKLGENHRELNAVLRAAERGAELTKRLLAFSRRQPLRPTLLNFNDMLDGVVGMMARTLGEPVEIVTTRADNVWPVMADQSQIESAILNLAINARDAMENGGTLSIETGNYSLDDADRAVKLEALMGDYAYIRVRDTGTGISREVLPRVFEPFFTTKEVGEGSGLGLSMVYGFMRQSGGYVDIETEDGRGTAVTLYFPKAKAVETQAVQFWESVLPRGNGEAVFVIEDDPDVRDFIVKLLNDLDYKVGTAPDAVAALSDMSDIHKASVLLCDVVLPGGVNGPQFVERVRGQNSDIKVVFMSGYPLNVVAKDIAIMQSKFFLPKPFRRREFAEMIREAIDS